LPDNSEKAYLAELVRDFPPANPVDLEVAWKDIQTRYTVLEQHIPQFLNSLQTSDSPFSHIFYVLCRSFHEYLFVGVIANAGEFRKNSDPNMGFVAYGREVTRNPSTSQFSGSAPSSIVNDLSQVCQLLKREEMDPICTSMRFYQRFVRIHPFYDGNGRVARILITLYLSYHGYYPLWKKLEETKKNEFLRKLNMCHLREKEKSFEMFFGYLCSFWREYVIPKKDFVDPS
jgi:Fic family protein